ncbi:MAG: hypothetical protein ACLGIY_02090, partial [Betaproteobacteria bacterium]
PWAVIDSQPWRNRYRVPVASATGVKGTPFRVRIKWLRFELRVVWAEWSNPELLTPPCGSHNGADDKLVINLQTP